MSTVALLAEGVDRNSTISIEFGSVMNVALLAEGVDRNRIYKILRSMDGKSPSSRRAWIEIRSLGASGVKTAGRPPRGGRG